MLLKLYCNLRVIPIAFAAKDGSLAVFGMPDTRSLLQAGLAGAQLSLVYTPQWVENMSSGRPG